MFGSDRGKPCHKEGKKHKVVGTVADGACRSIRIFPQHAKTEAGKKHADHAVPCILVRMERGKDEVARGAGLPKRGWITPRNRKFPPGHRHGRQSRRQLLAAGKMTEGKEVCLTQGPRRVYRNPRGCKEARRADYPNPRKMPTQHDTETIAQDPTWRAWAGKASPVKGSPNIPAAPRCRRRRAR